MVEECLHGIKFGGSGHVACLVNLSDSRVIELDVIFKMASKPFLFDEIYSQSGYYWEIQEKKNPLGLHSSIRKINQKELLGGIYESRGYFCNQSKQYSQAIDYYTKATEVNSEFADAFFNRGNTYNNLGQYNRAISDFDRALEINKKLYRAFRSRGLTYLNLGNYDQSLSDCNRAIEINSHYSNAYILRGRVYSEFVFVAESFFRKIGDRTWQEKDASLSFWV
jgi:tetratricopeptide (TPR) repeat protein